MNTSWKDGIGKLPRIVPDFELDAQKTALMIIDMQYGSAHPDYGLGLYHKEKYPEVHSYYYGRIARTVIPNHIRLLNFFRENRLRIVYLALGSMLQDGSDLAPLRQRRSNSTKANRWAGDFEYRILEEIKPLEGELVMNKTAGNAFCSSAIDQTLRNMGIECLVITGLNLVGCVGKTARDAADRGYKTVVVEDATAGWSPEHNNAWLRIFATLDGRVATTDEVCLELAKQLKAPVSIY